ncbi:MAG: CinA family protein [Saccharospirillum sp.]
MTGKLPQAHELAQRLLERRWRLISVESCTGGGIGAALTALSGSSDWYEGGWITYSNALKQRLGVPAELLERYGAVSEPVARSMVACGVQAARVECGVAVTGIAGPTGGSSDKPVGTVWIAWAWPDKERAQRYQFSGDRDAVREQAVEAAVHGLLAGMPV